MADMADIRSAAAGDDIRAQITVVAIAVFTVVNS
jgi:hypothetical protein